MAKDYCQGSMNWEKFEKTQKEEEQDWLLLMQINRAETWFLNG